MFTFWLVTYLMGCLLQICTGGIGIPLSPAVQAEGGDPGGGGSRMGIPQANGWSCPQIENHPTVECSCDLPHTLRCTGDRSAMQIIGRTLRSLPTHRAVSLLDCTVQNVSALGGPVLEGVALHGLVVSSGEIRDIHSTAFRGLAGPLQALGLPNNQLTSVPTEALKHLQGLDRLDLSHNKLVSIDNTSFEGLVNLTFLELSDNQLTYLAPGCFKPLKLLSTLRLRGNQLDTSTLSSLKDLLSLSELDLSSNKIAGPLGPNTLPSLGQLHLLQLGENELTSIKRGCLAGLSNLMSLGLHHNQIDVIEDHAFRQLTNLTELDLSNNEIVTISGNSLSHIARLQKLDLAHNFLRSLTSYLIKPLLALNELRLDDNDISIVDGDTITPEFILERFTIADNPLNCDCSMLQFATWLRNNSKLATSDLNTAVCTIPPHLEGAALRSLSTRSFECGADHPDYDEEPEFEEHEDIVRDDDNSIDMMTSAAAHYTHELHTEAADSKSLSGEPHVNEETENDEEEDGDEDDYISVSKEQVALSEYSFDGALVKLHWSVGDTALPYTCDAVFVYEVLGTKESFLSSEPLHCNSQAMTDPKKLQITVPGSRDLQFDHMYRYCVVLLQGPRDSDELNLVLGCSDIIPLHSTSTTKQLVRKEPSVKVSSIESNVTDIGVLLISLSLFGYPPPRPHNMEKKDVIDPSPEEMTEYFEALNNCYVSLAVFFQGSLIAQSDTQCEHTHVKLEGFMGGPYKVCASMSEFQVTGPNTKCVRARKIDNQTVLQTSFRHFRTALVAATILLVLALLILLWVSKKLINKPKNIVQRHQCFRPDQERTEEVQHARYVKLHATTNV